MFTITTNSSDLNPANALRQRKYVVNNVSPKSSETDFKETLVSSLYNFMLFSSSIKAEKIC